MADLVLHEVACMTSREIAELTGKRHDNVLRDIDRLLEALSSELRAGFSTAYVGDPANGYRIFTLDRDSTYCLVAGYDANSRMKIIKRWQELEQAATPSGQSLIPQQRALLIFKAELEIYALFEVPEHIAQVEVVKTVLRETGLDYSPALLSAPAQSNIPDEDVMLEPNDMAKALGIRDGATLNQWLEAAGYQHKTVSGWEPTDAGKPYCVRHQWKTTFKTGYNLKWAKRFCRQLLPSEWSTTLNR